jgi:prepilin-type N-terminal cleavage/methylation domain-containing protein
MNFKKIQKNKAFTLIETLVAISVLSVAVGGALTIAQKSLQSAYYSKDETTASYLAAEGIELVRNIRDNTAIANSNGATLNWLNGLSACVGGSHCRIDGTNLAIVSCGGACSSSPLKITTTGIYDYAAGVATRFTRDITLVETVVDREAIVTSTVTWSSGPFSNHPITLTERILNWR